MLGIGEEPAVRKAVQHEEGELDVLRPHNVASSVAERPVDGVLKADGSVIPGLYATGNTSASVMGNDYAGPGATIGPAMAFGWIAAHHIAAAKSADVVTAAAR